ncbi:MAG: outer membrane protein assembly factor BamD [Saprospiraceae bacterium]|nr:outer membrane protein assembly factor BamD [Saprospiraceae bacterium]
MACKSEFETIRTGTDVNLMLKKSLEYYDKGDYAKAQSLMELVMPSIKGRPELEEVSYKYGYTHYNLKSFVSASYYFKNFALTFANSKYREEAEYMSAYSEFLQSPNYKLDQENTAKAIEGFQYFVNNFPESKRVKDCNRLIDELRKKQEKRHLKKENCILNSKDTKLPFRFLKICLKTIPKRATQSASVFWF